VANTDNNKVLIVSGMHRSGTSMITSYLSQIGINVGEDLYEADQHNPSGYYEDVSFLNFQSTILNTITEGGKDGWPDWGYTEDLVLNLDLLPSFKQQANDMILSKKNQKDGIWGWKDPRSTLLLDFWNDLIPEAKHLIIYRNPWEVARSVFKLGAEVFHENPDYPYQIWDLYNEKALEFYRKYPEKCLLISANAFLQNPTHLAHLLQKKFDFDLDESTFDDLSFFSSKLFYSQDISEELGYVKSNSKYFDRLKELSKEADFIPCYNLGEYLVDAVNSVQRSINEKEYELIIVNDGSNDPNTISVLKELESKGIFVHHQKNQGLAKARNQGFKLAKAPYILPLDADNKIDPAYFIKAITVLNENPDLGVVYSNSRIFGEKSGFQRTGSFQIERLLSGNYIDACAIIRKSAWKDVNGYDSDMPIMGYEDWDIWLSIYQKGWGFYYIE